jgi:hypothetical protein
MTQAKLELRGVHVFAKATNTGIYGLKKVNPYLRFGCKEGVLYIQSGRVFSEEGGEVAAKDLPGWFKEEVEKANPAALRECGWKG